MSKSTMVITVEEYDELLDALHMLFCLEANGVEDWEGFEKAMKMYKEEGNEHDGMLL